ncbi:hypothetical protein [uncultured Moraxella sp.]|uniref:hypothetical protein n=1 Tax=uncultured Moraxella sp. TaxID=263769 RepID=UPI0025F30B0D|nr:hypothetical protein [uncultured Moraxella sp.]
MSIFASLLLFGSLILLILGCIGLFNFRAFGMKSRGQSSAIFFGSAVASLILGSILMPTSQQATAEQITQTQTTTESTSAITEPVAKIEYVDAIAVGQHFNSLTELQRDAWNKENRLVIPTKGSCTVVQVQKVNWTSQVQNADYEVECETLGEVKPVVYFTKEYESLVTGLNIGDTLNYVGMVHSANHFGFWTSVYILGN